MNVLNQENVRGNQTVKTPWMYYDTARIAPSGNRDIVLLEGGTGTGTTAAYGASGNKTVFDTNMGGNGKIPSGINMAVSAIAVRVEAGSDTDTFVPARVYSAVTEAGAAAAVDDVIHIINNGMLRIGVGTGTSEYIYLPLCMFPQTQGVSVGLAGGGSSGALGIAQGVGSMYQFADAPLLLNDQISLKAVLTFPPDFALPSGQIARIQLQLHGDQMRTTG